MKTLKIILAMSAMFLSACDEKEEEEEEVIEEVECPAAVTELLLQDTEEDENVELDEDGCPLVDAPNVGQPTKDLAPVVPPPTQEEAANAEECEDADGHWWDGDCHADPKPTIADSESESDCRIALGYWYDEDCHEDKGVLGNGSWYVSTVNRDVWITGDEYPRTVQLLIPDSRTDAEFEKIECRSGSDPFGPCGEISTDGRRVSFVFAPEDYNEMIEYKISDQDFEEAVFQFNPGGSSYYRDPAGFTYVDCDVEYTGFYTFSAIETQIGTDYGSGDRVFCFGNADGDTFTASTSNAAGGDLIDLSSKPSTTFIGHTKALSWFINSRTDGGNDDRRVFKLGSGTSNVTFANLLVQSDGDSGYGYYIIGGSNNKVLGGSVTTSGSSARGIYFTSATSPVIDGVTVNTTGSSASGIEISSSTNVSVSGCQVKTTGDYANGVSFSQASTYGSVKGCTVKTTGDADAIYGAFMDADPDVEGYPGIDVEDTIMLALNEGNDQQVYAARIYDSKAYFKNSIFVVGSGNNSEALAVGNPGSIYETGNTNTRVDIEDNVFIRHHTISGSNGKAILLGDGTDGPTNIPDLRSVEVGTTTQATNTYCYYDGPSGSTFTGVLRDNHGEGAPTHFQESGASIDECSAMDKSKIYGALNYL